MGPVRIGVGTEWLLDGRAWRVVRQPGEVERPCIANSQKGKARRDRLRPAVSGHCPAADRYIAQDTKFLVEQEFSQAKILAHYTEGRLRPGDRRRVLCTVDAGSSRWLHCSPSSPRF